MIFTIYHLRFKLLFLLVLMFAGIQSANSANDTQRIKLLGHVPTVQIRAAHSVGRANPNENVSLTLVLPLRNINGLNDLLQRLYNPSDHAYGHYITPIEFTERFGPTTDDYAKVASFVTSSGFRIIGTHDNRRLLDVQGTVKVIEATFGTRLSYYQTIDGKIFRAPNDNPSIPALLRSQISYVVGLDNATVRHPYNHSLETSDPLLTSATTGSGPYGGLTPSDISRAYGLNGLYLTGFGQSLGLFELDGYKDSDIKEYESVYGLPNYNGPKNLDSERG